MTLPVRHRIIWLTVTSVLVCIIILAITFIPSYQSPRSALIGYWTSDQLDDASLVSIQFCPDGTYSYRLGFSWEEGTWHADKNALYLTALTHKTFDFENNKDKDSSKEYNDSGYSETEMGKLEESYPYKIDGYSLAIEMNGSRSTFYRDV